MTLLQEIQTACTPGQLIEKNYHTIAQVVNATRGPRLKTHMISERGIRGALGPINGSKFMRLLKDLETAAGTDTVPAWLAGVLTALEVPADDHVHYLDTLGCAMGWVKSDAGLDIGNAETRGLMDIIAAGNPPLAGAIATLKALAEEPNTVTWDQCQRAVLGE